MSATLDLAVATVRTASSTIQISHVPTRASGRGPKLIRLGLPRLLRLLRHLPPLGPLPTLLTKHIHANMAIIAFTIPVTTDILLPDLRSVQKASIAPKSPLDASTSILRVPSTVIEALAAVRRSLSAENMLKRRPRDILGLVRNHKTSTPLIR